MTRDVAFGLATLAVACGYYLIAAALPDTQLADAVGPRGLPKAYGMLLAGLSIILIGQSLVRRGRLVGAARSSPESPPSVRAVGVLLIGIAYVALVPWLGYAFALAGLIAATTYYQGGVLNRQVAIVAATGAGFFWLIFVWLLHIRQPVGIWSSLF